MPTLKDALQFLINQTSKHSEILTGKVLAMAEEQDEIFLP